MLLATLALGTPAAAERILVRDQDAYRAAVRALSPGDEIVLADGTWRDFQILFEGRGTAERPITLTAQTPGGVILSGQSNLRLSGEHLVVSNLVFRDGHTPTEEVIAFRRDSRRTASNSRVTGIVIDRFNAPDRRREDMWVSIYGQDNRVDHSHFVGKGNAGVTLAVIRPEGRSEPNRHRIDHNYFGPRPTLGSNGGETIRIGTSDESLSDSETVVEDNYFERCDGEVEIVSLKAGGNIVRGNTFFESQGSVVLRHGNGNLVERNVFIGNGRPNTGGIRVINRNQIVRDNYLEGLAGTGFASALAVMNGVPDSAINRYHQVANARIERNSFVATQRLTFAAGADAERSAAPIDSRFADNLIADEERGDPIRIDGDIAGIGFVGNVQNEVATPRLDRGVAHRPITLARAANGFLYPTDAALTEVGAPRDLRPVGREETGVRWYPKPVLDAAEPAEAAIEVHSGAALAVAIAQGGDAFRLGAGEYLVPAPIVIDRPIRIDGAGQARTRIFFNGDSLFRIEEGGRLSLSDLAVSGTGGAVIRTSDQSMIANYSVALSGVAVANINGDVIATSPATLADRITIRDSRFADVAGAVLAAHSETGTQGYYNVEEIEIAGSDFHRVGRIADVFRGGRDESTFGPRFALTGSTIRESGGPQAPSLLLSGVQRTRIADNRFAASGPIAITHSVGTPDTEITDNQLDDTPPPQVTEVYWQGPARAMLRNNQP
ncbi:MAG: right-handed parallel beta-helix repeat-containing protein [Sphingomonas sp.]|nr:right-handed parallel beta-helix repeat-containing protein [Sphingomonas sp.]